MELDELAAYALRRYHIQEQHKWADFPGLSVLLHPKTGMWIALLMRQYDSATGEFIERCDLRCGSEILSEHPQPFLSSPFRMKKDGWVGLDFASSPDSVFVCRLFDQAYTRCEGNGYTIVLNDPAPASSHGSTPLPFQSAAYSPPREFTPPKIAEMRRMISGTPNPSRYESSRPLSRNMKAELFVRQAEFMKDYEDDLPWEGNFFQYFPTYSDLNVRKLRGYFSWRAKIRRGIYEAIPLSAQYIYAYELLNGIGASDMEDRLRQLAAFYALLKENHADPAFTDNLQTWIRELGITEGLPKETISKYLDSPEPDYDSILSVLQNISLCTDDELIRSLCLLDSKLSRSPVLDGQNERGRALFSRVIRHVFETCQENGSDLFTICFGLPETLRWMPLINAVVLGRPQEADRSFQWNNARVYFCTDGRWYTRGYNKKQLNRSKLQSLLHGADLRLRRYLKTGRYLRENPSSAWAVKPIEEVLQKDREEQIEAARPKITISLSGLDRIRRDAEITRDSLLTEEELSDLKKLNSEPEPSPVTAESETDLPLDALQTGVLRALLKNESVSAMLRQQHKMPSVIADEINDALMEEIGDTVISCESDELSLIEDYRDDIATLLEGEHL